MIGFIVLVFLAAAIASVVLVISNFSDLQASKIETARLRPEMNAAILNADASQMTALCAGYPESAMGRVVKAVFAKSEQLPVDEATRSELLRMFLGQALASETEKAMRGTNLLRTIALTCIPLGLMATGWDMAHVIASPGWRDSNHVVPPYAAMANAVPYTIAGLILSLTAFILHKYLEARSRTALSELDDSCSDLLTAFLSRRADNCP